VRERVNRELIDISSMLVNKEFREKIYEHVISNKVISNYYEMLKEEFKPKPKMYANIQNKIDRLKECNATWESNYYKELNIKNFKKTIYCKDKFCLNCKKWRQAQRMKKFLPELQKYDKDLYFITFTVPNVEGIKVRETINKIFKAHRKLIKYLDGTNKAKIFNAARFNFIGGIRVLEITISRKEHNEKIFKTETKKYKDVIIEKKEKYHVHIHCAYILKDYEEEGIKQSKIKNQFSIDHTGRRDYVRLF
jgi:hypothetical protein